MRVLRVLLVVLLLFTAAQADFTASPSQRVSVAISTGDVKGLARLLDQDPSVMNVAGSARTLPPIFTLMSVKVDDKILDEVFRHRFDLNQTVDGNTPLTLGISSGNLPAVRRLLQAGARTDTKTEMGYTPLYLAVSQAIGGNAAGRDMVRLLLQEGADPNVLAKNGSPPLAAVVAASAQNDARAAELARVLIQGGAKPDPDVVIQGKKLKLSAISKPGPKTAAALRAR